jgi:hypothetical protein
VLADGVSSGPADRAKPRPGLRGRGITYDTGFFQTGVAPSTHEPFDPHVVEREMRIIAQELNCNAVRVTGSDQDRLEIAASYAADAGLEVWYSPYTNDLDADAMLAFLTDAADRCERLRRRGNRVVLTTGSELAFTVVGFIPGATFVQRTAFLTSGNPQVPMVIGQLPGKINAFLAEAVPVVRERFHGKISHASLSFERIDWTPFDIVGIDFYPSMVDGAFPAGTGEPLAAHGKPVAVTEFGCPAYAGAAARAGTAQEIVQWDVVANVAARLDGDYVRDEAEQADYLTGLLDVCVAAGVDSAFVYTLASRNMPTRTTPREDVDRASFGVAKVLEHGFGETFDKVPWEPKAAFWALADYYAGCRTPLTGPSATSNIVRCAGGRTARCGATQRTRSDASERGCGRARGRSRRSPGGGARCARSRTRSFRAPPCRGSSRSGCR